MSRCCLRQAYSIPAAKFTHFFYANTKVEVLAVSPRLLGGANMQVKTKGGSGGLWVK
jgi:hypothetical protein